MAKNMKIRRGNDGFSYPYTSPDLVVDENGKSNTKKFEEIEYSKADKNEVFTMANMGQDIKEAMTGGSVAVVGKNTILEENITNKQITPYKTNFIQYGNNLLDTNTLISGYLYSDGNIKNGNYKTTTYIPFTNTDKINLSRIDKPEINKLMTRRAIRTACFYDSSYNLLSDFYYDNTDLIKESITYQGSGNVAYIRVSIQSLLIDNAMLYLGEERTEYEKNGVIINKLKLNENLKEEIETKIKINNNVLKDKTIINFGDSIGAGDGNNGVGYAELLAKKNDMTCYDYAVGGATITTSTNDILAQIEKAKNDKKTADYILFDGFTNDINNGAVKELGKISDGYSQTKDINTFSGAFEEICFRLKSYWKGIPIFYVRVHKMNSRDTELQNTYSTRAKTLCERWSIPVIDIYNEGGLNTYITDHKTLYTNNADGTHPNELGYNTFYVPLIEKNLKGGATSSANIKADNIKIEDTNNNFTSTNVEGVLEEVSAQLKDIAKQIESGNIGNNIEPALMDMPKVFITGDKFNDMTAEKNEVSLDMEYISKTSRFTSAIKTKWQGSSSVSNTSFLRKNLTAKLYADNTYTEKLKKIFKDWKVKANKYVWKSNWIDISASRNIVSARLWNQIVSSRTDYNSLPIEIRESPKNCAIDGFPFKLYVNGTYDGIYTWNIPKDGYMFNMDENNPNHAVLCAEKNNDVGTLTGDGISACEFRKTAKIDGSDWSLEFPDILQDSIKTSFNNLITCIMTSSDTEFKANINKYLDIQSAIDYYIFAYFMCGTDSLGKNIIMMTYDGIKWLCSMYDMDTTWGLNFTGSNFYKPTMKCPEEYQENNSLLWQRLESCFAKELQDRYFELRKTVLSEANIINEFEKFLDVIPYEIKEEEKNLEQYSDRPSKYTNNIKQIRNFVRDRAIYVDGEFKNIVPIMPTGITLDNTSLTVALNGTARLTATIEPNNATNKNIIWASSNESIATVTGGVVSGLKEGTCIITASTNNGFIATCNISVQVIEISVTGLTISNTTLKLDKDTTTQYQLSVSYIPSNTTQTGVTWLSTNTQVATVNRDGLISILGKGTTNIIATSSHNTSIDATCELTVTGSNLVEYYLTQNEGWSIGANSVTTVSSWEIPGFNDNIIEFPTSSSTVATIECNDLEVVADNTKRTQTKEIIAGIKTTNNYLSIKLSVDKVANQDLNGLRIYLEQNPIKVKFKLSNNVKSFEIPTTGWTKVITNEISNIYHFELDIDETIATNITNATSKTASFAPCGSSALTGSNNDTITNRFAISGNKLYFVPAHQKVNQFTAEDVTTYLEQFETHCIYYVV